MAKKQLSIQQKIENYLLTGKTLTPTQIAKKYALSNPHNPVYLMEAKGISVSRVYKQLKNGRRTVTYSL